MYPWHKKKEPDVGMQPHHAAWLDAHPRRTQVWLRERLSEGFDIHHVDGDHTNNDSANLVLIEHADHMRLHGLAMEDTTRTAGIPSRKPRKYRSRRVAILPDGRLIWLAPRERAVNIVRRILEVPARYECRMIPKSWKHYEATQRRLGVA